MDYYPNLYYQNQKINSATFSYEYQPKTQY